VTLTAGVSRLIDADLLVETPADALSWSPPGD
jgi:hypothetical protein